MIRHIRKTDAKVTDHRFRGTSAYSNKLRPVFCGALPTTDDHSKIDASRVLAAAHLRPDWAAELCPACVQELNKYTASKS